MTTRKHYASAFIALSSLALAGCGHSSDSGGSAPGPNAMDQAAAARMQSGGGPQAAAQADGQAAAAKAGHSSAPAGAPQNPPK